MSQERISMDQLEKYFNDKIYNVKWALLSKDASTKSSIGQS
jgi:hypothetical protein